MIYIYVYDINRIEKNEQQIRSCIAQYFIDTDTPACDLGPMLRTNKGKPYFENDVPRFSVSDSGDYWGCAVYGAALGFDIEKKQERARLKIARRFFHPEEIKYLENQDYRDFFDIWTAKESCVKYTGIGLSEPLNRFSVINGSGNIGGQINGLYFHHIFFERSYSMCVCSERPAEYKLRVFR